MAKRASQAAATGVSVLFLAAAGLFVVTQHLHRSAVCTPPPRIIYIRICILRCFRFLLSKLKTVYQHKVISAGTSMQLNTSRLHQRL